MGLSYNKYLNSNRIYGCKCCKAHLANHEEIISRVRDPRPLARLWDMRPEDVPLDKNGVPYSVQSLCMALMDQNFRGQHGKAYLFNKVVNINYGMPVERNMTTGRHVVRDISCRGCGDTVGWTYDKAYEPAEKYKEGKFILEAELLCTVS